MKTPLLIVVILSMSVLAACAPSPAPADGGHLTRTPSAVPTTVPTVKVSPAPTSTPGPSPLPSPDGASPVPPSTVWREYDAGAIHLAYPSNWLIYESGDMVTITNFRLESLSKGQEEGRLKIDIPTTPLDISSYPTLAAYLEAQIAADEVVRCVERPHREAGYEVVHCTLRGLMGNPEATYEQLYVASAGQAMVLLAYGEGYPDVVEGIAATLTW